MEKKRRRIEGGDCKFPLPEVLIQHVQSFLGGKEAAQTSVLSKSWYTAWSTRPNLEFDQHDFLNPDNEEGFWKFAKDTLQRYEALNLKIESFKLCVQNLLSCNCCVAKELIVKAMKMGAVDFSFELRNYNQTFTLPHEVLESETLTRLSLYRCNIDLMADRKVSCRKLKSLNLNRIWVEDDIISSLISSCPLIENLTLCMYSPDYGLRSVVDGLRRNLYELYKLKSLFLGDVDVNALFFSNLSSNFPCLKDLTLEYCSGYNYKGIQLSSRSLECITFKQVRLLRADLDVPSIRKFKFSGVNWPSLFFKTASREWESDISVCCGSPSTASFLKLKKLLTCLSLSKISISLCLHSVVEKKSVDFQCLPETAVENLTLHALPSVCFMVLKCLLWSCHPKFITLHLVVTRGKAKNDFLEFLSERNVEGVRGMCLMMNHDLEDVDVKLFEGGFTERQPLPQKIHFQLKWRGGRA